MSEPIERLLQDLHFDVPPGLVERAKAATASESADAPTTRRGDGGTRRDPARQRMPWAPALVAVVLAVAIVAALLLIGHTRQGVPVTPPPHRAVGHCPASSSYGLLVAGGAVEMVTPSGCLAASATLATPTVQNCAEGLPAVLTPPVSASDTTVYYRDGDTTIRSLKADGSGGDVTTVPGSATTVSFFAVSPDDQRIAVMVEDMAPPGTTATADRLTPGNIVSLRLYVEDLHGHGHHVELYRATVPKGNGALTMWPMGWDQGALVVASVFDCSATPVTMPAEWHLVSATTGNRLVVNPGTAEQCNGSFWQSPAGVACTVNDTTFVMDWTGKQVATARAPGRGVGPDWSALSPAGRSVAMVYASTEFGLPFTEALNWGEAGSVITKDALACGWISDSSMLAPDAVIAYPSGAVVKLPASGTCAGRFPGAL